MFKGTANNMKKVIAPVSRFLNNISLAVLAGLMLIVVADVLLRRLFNAPILGAHDITSIGFSLVVFLPMGWCALMDRHVDLTVLVNRLPEKPRRFIEACILFMTTATLGVVCWQLMRQGIRLQTMNAETSVLGIPLYPFVYLSTLSMAMMTLAFFINFLSAMGSMMENNR